MSEELNEEVFEYSQIQDKNQFKSKIYHEYDMNEMFPFKKTKIRKFEDFEVIQNIFRVPPITLCIINGISVNKIQTFEFQKELIAKRFSLGKTVLIPKNDAILSKDRCSDLAVKDIKEFKLEKTMLRLDEPTYFCYYCTINGDI